MYTIIAPTNKCGHVLKQEPLHVCEFPAFQWSWTGPNGPWVSLCHHHTACWPFQGSGEHPPMIRLEAT